MPGRPVLVSVLAILFGTPVVWAAIGTETALAANTPADRTWRWPLDSSSVVRGFEAPAERWHPGHRGVDLLAHSGVVVRAAGAGVVAHAGMIAGRGVVTIRHGALRTTYEPVSPSVQAGARVEAGDIIGTLDHATSHCAPRACLHWGVLRGDTYLDPLVLVGAGPARLLPVWDHPPPYPARAPAGPAGGPDTDVVPAPPLSAEVPPTAPATEAAAADGRHASPAGAATGLALATGVGVGVAALLGRHPA